MKGNESLVILETIDRLVAQGSSTNELDIAKACDVLDNRTIHKTLRCLYKEGVLDYGDAGDYFRMQKPPLLAESEESTSNEGHSTR